MLSASVPGRAVRKAIGEAVVLRSEATVDELWTVLSRPRFDRYLSAADRRTFLDLFMRVAEPVEIIETHAVCRDPHDDKFLDLAVNGGAAVIVSGDADLLALHPFMDISIFAPSDWLVLGTS